MRKYDQGCPIARTLDIIGDRWTIIIVRDLFLGRTKFSEFAANPGLPPKVLSGRLKKLEEEGIVERHVYSEHPLRAEYRLTERGEDLLPVILAIGTWGFRHAFEGEPELAAAAARAVYEAIPEARETLVREGLVDRDS
jgi:DNA-binding HxlR family transcriptional regulator